MYSANPLDYIGYFGPAILFAFVVINIYKRQGLMILYVIVAYLNMHVNHILKNIIQEPRPSGEIHLFPNADRKGARKFGMPSGHAQGVAFNSVFVMLAKPTLWVTLFASFVWIVTLIQRCKYRNHTWEQVIAGSFVGAMVAYVAYQICTFVLESRMLKPKEDMLEHPPRMSSF